MCVRLCVKSVVCAPHHREPRMIDIGQSSASQGSEATVIVVAEMLVMEIGVVRCGCVVVC